MKRVCEPRSRGRATDHDTSRNVRETANGNLPKNEAAFNRKFRVWERRDWAAWLNRNLAFPFTAKRTDDEDVAYFTDIADREPFRLGHHMEIIGIASEILPRYGILARVKEGRRRGWVPLMDLEVIPKTDPNYRPVREYTVWFANR